MTRTHGFTCRAILREAAPAPPPGDQWIDLGAERHRRRGGLASSVWWHGLVAAVAGVSLLGVARAAPIRVGLEPYPPYSFADAAGKPAGFCVDLLDAIGRRENLEFDYEIKPWEEVMDDFNSGRVGVLANVIYLKSRTADIDFSVAHSALPVGVYLRPELADLSSFEQLQGKRVAATRNAMTHIWLLAQHWQGPILATETVLDSLRAVDAGQADAVITSRYVAERYIREEHLNRLVPARFDVPGLKYRFHFGVHHGDTELLFKLNNGLAELREDGEYERIYGLWLTPLAPRPVRLRDLLPYLGPAAIVLLLVLGALWRQRRLLGQLARQTEALRESEDRYRSFFDDDLAGAFIADEGGRILACNPAFVRIFGFDTVPQAVGTELARLFPRPAEVSPLDDLRAGGKVQTRELEMRGRDGQPVQVVANLVGTFNPAGKLVGLKGYVIDTSESKRLESQLRQAQKMEAIGRLAGGVAHDFNNILTAIIGNTELALLNEGLDADTRSAVAEIKSAGHRAAGLTRQLLTFSRQQVVQPVVLDLNAVAADMEKMLHRVLGEDIELQLKLDPALGRTTADQSQIEQVLLNLAVNARDAMPEGGRLLVETRNVDLDETYTRMIAGLRAGSYVSLVVSDDGCGMDAATKARLFEPFFTTKGDGKGTGLGLATVYGIVKQHQGHIDVYSEPGSGSVFRVYFPRLAAGAEAAGTRAPMPLAQRGTESILLVEDNDSVRTVTAKILASHGYQVAAAENGPVALRLFKERADGFDLVLTDVVMKEMNGPDLVERLREDVPDLKALFMSGFADSRVLGQVGRNGTFTIVEKPFTQQTLLRKVRETLDRAA